MENRYNGDTYMYHIQVEYACKQEAFREETTLYVCVII